MAGSKLKGYALGCIAAVSYGLNPLFAIPLHNTGMQVDSVLFYRYVFAVAMMAVMMRLNGKSFALKRNEVLPLVVVGLLFSCSSLFLFQSFNYMDAGIASTILFVYPVMVALIMTLCFGERLGVVKISAIAMAVAGIAMLYKGEGGVSLSLTGVLYVLASSLVYALYIVGVNRSVLKTMSGLKLTFYAILFGMSIYVVRLRGGVDLQPLTDLSQWGNALGLALFPTLISLVTITMSIHHIGSTPAAILGALEPVTALVVGAVMFGERLTPGNMVGIVLILSAVTLIVAGQKGWVKLKEACRRK